MEKFLGVAVEKVLAAEAIDTAQYQRVVVRILLQGSANLERQVAAIGTVGVAAVTDNGGADVLERSANLIAGNGRRTFGETTPTFKPFSRSWSATSLAFSAAEFSNTTATSASSMR